jgi:hypothetical protein
MGGIVAMVFACSIYVRSERRRDRPIQSHDVVLPIATLGQIRLRCVTQPDAAQAALLDRLGIAVPKRMRLAEAPGRCRQRLRLSLRPKCSDDFLAKALIWREAVVESWVSGARGCARTAHALSARRSGVLRKSAIGVIGEWRTASGTKFAVATTSACRQKKVEHGANHGGYSKARQETEDAVVTPLPTGGPPRDFPQ